MKNLLFVLALAVALTGGGIVFAQTIPAESNAAAYNTTVVDNSSMMDTVTTDSTDSADAAVLDPSITKRNSDAIPRYMNNDESATESTTEDTTEAATDTVTD